ncbi:MAG TPA: hypothetical protein VGZ52_04970 [Acidimicrobiales bacterium]|jgi:hypothetical protein|nr:hypothetical protein [Acidimicrobiales bacterium]
MRTRRWVALIACSVLAVAALALVAPGARAQTYGGRGTLAPSSSNVATGGSLTLSGDGFAPNSTITIEIHTDPISLGTAVADSTGHFEKQVTLPIAVAAGQHTVTAVGTAP